MKPLAYYNEIDKYAAQWLRNLIAADLIAPGDVDERSIKDVKPDDLTGYTQCHFFAGIGGWSLAARLAGWPDDRPIWTGSCPCQPFSVAGRGKGIEDERHLWPDFYRLIRGSRPAVVMGEQVAGAAGYTWLDGVLVDLEAEAYTGRAVDIPACSVNAPQIRSRLYWLACATNKRYERSGQTRRRRIGSSDGRADGGLACADRTGLEGRQGERSDPRAQHTPTKRDRGAGSRLGGASGSERWPDAEGRLDVNERADSGRQEAAGRSELAGPRGFWDDWQLIGPDPEGKYRRVKPGITPLDTRLPGDVGQIRGYGNAICPELAAEVIRAYMEVSV